MTSTDNVSKAGRVRMKIEASYINPLTPNDYSGRTALLPLNVAFYIFIQQI